MEKFEETRKYLTNKLPPGWTPQLAIVCGSGLGGLVETLEPVSANDSKPIELHYVDIPNFARSTVQGHAGKLVFGRLGGQSCVCMVGRLHLYEGHSLSTTTFPIRIMSLLGVKTLFLTNAAGSLNHDRMKVGNVCVLTDHINIPGMAGNNPLIGPNLDQFGPRFPATSDAYDRRLRSIALEAGREIDFGPEIMSEGVYAFVAGPSYETKAEARFLRMAGADVVGMSTVPEVIVARHCGLRVLALSLITNLVVMDANEDLTSIGKATHEEVLKASSARAVQMQQLVKIIAAKLNREMVN